MNEGKTYREKGGLWRWEGSKRVEEKWKNTLLVT